MSMSALPTDILSAINQYLDLQSFGRLGCVSKRFQQAQQDESSWETLAKICFPSEVPVPDIKSCKEIGKRAVNLLSNKTLTNHYFTDKPWHKSTSFTLLDDGTPIEISPTALPLMYEHRNWSTGTVTSIDLAPLGPGEVVDTSIGTLFWAVLNNRGIIGLFHTNTGNFVRNLDSTTLNEDGSTKVASRVKCQQNEVIAHLTGEIQIWDCATGTRFSSIPVPLYSGQFVSTRNYIVCYVASGAPDSAYSASLISVNRTTLVTTKIASKIYPRLLQATDDQVLIVCNSGLKVWEETGRTYQIPVDTPQATFFGKWILARKGRGEPDKGFGIWDRKTGQKHPTTLIAPYLRDPSFFVNGTQLMLRGVRGDPHLYQDYQYTHINFSSTPVTFHPKLSSNPNHTIHLGLNTSTLIKIGLVFFTICGVSLTTTAVLVSKSFRAYAFRKLLLLSKKISHLTHKSILNTT